MNLKKGKLVDRRHRKSTFKLRLTAMIDMFTILLVFLLKSYSAEGQIVTVTKDLKLPESTSQKSPRVTSVVAITSEWLLVDGRPIEKLSVINQDSALVIPALEQELGKLRRITEGIGEISDQMTGFQGNIAIQADREIEFKLIKRIMLTCGQVGYSNMLLTVMQKET